MPPYFSHLGEVTRHEYGSLLRIHATISGEELLVHILSSQYSKICLLSIVYQSIGDVTERSKIAAPVRAASSGMLERMLVGNEMLTPRAPLDGFA